MNLPLPLRLCNVFAVALFALFSWAQANDIDPATYYHASSLDATLWLLFYALIAVLFAVSLFKRVPGWILVVAALACGFELVRTAPGLWENLFGGRSFTMLGESMSASDPRVELSREFFGALIALAAVGVLWWERRRFGTPRSKSAPSHPA